MTAAFRSWCCSGWCSAALLCSAAGEALPQMWWTMPSLSDTGVRLREPLRQETSPQLWWAAPSLRDAQERLRDRSVQDPVRGGELAVLEESMLEGPLPERELALPEPPVTRKSPAVISLGPGVLVISGWASAIFDDNIFNAFENAESDFVYTVTPSLVMGMGDYAEQKKTFLTAGFAPSFVNFQRRRDLSDVDYDGFLHGQYTFTRLKIDSRLSFERRTGQDLDAPGRNSRDFYTADVVAEYAITERTTLEASGLAVHRDYLTQIDSDEFLNRDFVTYSVSPKLQLALGGGFGKLTLVDGEEQTYEQSLLRVWYQPGAKLSIRAIGGMDFRHFNNGISGRTTAVGDVGLIYLASPSGKTKLALDGYRRVQNSSSLPGQNYLSTGVVLRVTQRVFRDFDLDLETGYQHATYYPTATGGDVVRDDYCFIRPRIRYNLNDWGSVSLFYLARSRDSSVLTRSFENQQMGIELAVGF